MGGSRAVRQDTRTVYCIGLRLRSSNGHRAARLRQSVSQSVSQSGGCNATCCEVTTPSSTPALTTYASSIPSREKYSCSWPTDVCEATLCRALRCMSCCNRSAAMVPPPPPPPPPSSSSLSPPMRIAVAAAAAAVVSHPRAWRPARLRLIPSRPRLSSGRPSPARPSASPAIAAAASPPSCSSSAHWSPTSTSLNDDGPSPVEAASCCCRGSGACCCCAAKVWRSARPITPTSTTSPPIPPPPWCAWVDACSFSCSWVSAMGDLNDGHVRQRSVVENSRCLRWRRPTQRKTLTVQSEITAAGLSGCIGGIHDNATGTAAITIVATTASCCNRPTAVASDKPRHEVRS